MIAIIWNVISLESRRKAEKMTSKYMFMACLFYSQHIDVRIGLFITRTDHVLVVYIE